MLLSLGSSTPMSSYVSVELIWIVTKGRSIVRYCGVSSCSKASLRWRWMALLMRLSRIHLPTQSLLADSLWSPPDSIPIHFGIGNRLST